MQGQTGSTLSSSVSSFAKAVAAISSLLLLPQIIRYFRPILHEYFGREFSVDVTFWGTWIIIILTAAVCYFGISALLQIILRKLFYRGIRWNGF